MVIRSLDPDARKRMSVVDDGFSGPSGSVRLPSALEYVLPDVSPPANITPSICFASMASMNGCSSADLSASAIAF